MSKSPKKKGGHDEKPDNTWKFVGILFLGLAVLGGANQKGLPTKQNASSQKQPINTAAANVTGKLLHSGCPTGVALGTVFDCDSRTGKCICK